ncbi:phasin family protein [Paraburkholderia sp. LEh10]|uniref:phasin family protein n=1 Tax=Paraburkholderia sp. LEh10 TaxID=2821353 RepID=UPI0028A66248|nr:phasin family protein [Paraburkholderia sp. LEh10]
MRAPQQLFALHAKRSQAAMEAARSYWRQVYNIVVSARAELTAGIEADLPFGPPHGKQRHVGLFSPASQAMRACDASPCRSAGSWSRPRR